MLLNSINVSTKQERIAALAKQSPLMAFTSLAHLMDIDWLKEAYRRNREQASALQKGPKERFLDPTPRFPPLAPSGTRSPAS